MEKYSTDHLFTFKHINNVINKEDIIEYLKTFPAVADFRLRY